MADQPIPTPRPDGDRTVDLKVSNSQQTCDLSTRTAARTDAVGRSSGLPPPAPPGYELFEEVGAGGMGVVYRARDLPFGRDVALKFLQDRYPPDSPTARRFLDEARITGQLQHPAIPPVHAIGTLPDGRPFLVMKLIGGETLDALLAAGRGDARRLVPVFAQVCQAVAYAHARRVIHRDLKPANLMVGAFGEVQVMDWGLAKVLGPANEEGERGEPEESETDVRARPDNDLATQTGSVLGTPAYMAPEQARGAVEDVDERADVFGLGAVLCAILTGRPPYSAGNSNAVRLMAIRAETGDALTRLDACGAEPELVGLCKGCLAADPQQRPRDAGEVARAVSAHLAAAEERARQAELARARAEAEQREQRKRRKVQLALAAAVALIVAAGGAFAWWRNDQQRLRQLEDEHTRLEQERIEAEGRATAERLAGERDAEARNKARQARDGVTANLALAEQLREQYEFETAEAALAQAEALAAGGVPERLAEVRQAQADLALVVRLDDIRFRKWVWIPPGTPNAGPVGPDLQLEGMPEGGFNTVIAPPEYRKTFTEHGLDLTALPPE